MVKTEPGRTAEAIVAVKETSVITDRAKQMVINRRAHSPVRVERIPEMVAAWDEYTRSQQEARRPVTWAGYAMAGGISYDSINRMRQGELDYVVEEYKLTHDLHPDSEYWIDDNGEEHILARFSDLVKSHCELPIMDQLESNCYQLKGNQVGSIFGLKARFGWQDDSPQVQHNTAVVVADADKARNLLEMINPAKR